MVPVARALGGAGHDVVIATSAPFCPFVEAAGFRALSVGLDWLESEVERAFPDVFPDPTSLGDIQRGWQTVFTRAGAAAVPELVRVVGDLHPDLVLGESLDLTGPLCADATGVPHALVGVGPPRPLPMLADRVGAPWNTARAALGLAPDPGLARFCPHLYLDTCPPSLRPYPPSPQAAAGWQVRPMSPDHPDASSLGWLEGERDQPLVYVTMGTVFNRVADAFRPVLEALADEPVSVLVTVGANRDPATVDALAANIRIERFVPQSVVMPGADLVICHGGFNTTVMALAHGVPVIGLPVVRDNSDTTFRVRACGAGLELDPRTATPRSVGMAVRAVLGDALYRANAQRLAREIAAMPPPDAAVLRLERLVDERPTVAAVPRLWGQWSAKPPNEG
jgi:UDP:flavonoid glycosyltransferase YjiC (YdhE family)